MTKRPVLTPLLLLALCAPPALAQDAPTPAAPATEPVTIFPHPDAARYFVAGQANIILQGHTPFHSPYEGDNSFLSRGEYKTSLVGTLFMGFQVVRNPRWATDILVDEESAGGRGDSEALGLAGFTNLDVVRNPSLGSTPYLARYELHQVIGLSSKNVDVERTPFSLETSLPERRLEFHFGKMGLPDFLDQNSIGTDSHLQFLNWTTDNNGAWDYAADTRGYTTGMVAEYTDHAFTLRYALAMLPTVPNGIDLDTSFRRASGQNWELEHRHEALPFLPKRKGAVRLLGYRNQANMGVYRTQNQLFLAGKTATPDIDAHALHPTVKYGFGLNAEQELTENLRIFGRFGWNEGQHESWAYTEVDQTIEFGGDYAMKDLLHRANDKAGIAFVTNAIKRDHQAYLKLGGKGFILGDGNLDYAREDILEGYYNLHAWRGVFYALDMQFIEHPGYNQARGPVPVGSIRMHVDF
ncbi:carbohydrate porin [Granulicella rosea]|nr:carbohydrate porin [Granulicella rosea]